MPKRRNQPVMSAALKAALVIAGLTALAAAAQLLIPGEPDNPVSLPKVPEQISPLQVEAGDVSVPADFVTHLPLVVFDVAGQEPGADGRWDEEKGYYVPSEKEPYAHGSLWVVDNEDGINRLTDLPTVQGNMQMRLRGNSSLRFPKKQYLVEFLDEQGNKAKKDILGMGADSDWILNISWQDPSLMRNYLAYTLGKGTEVETPDARYCELVRRRADGYEYLGVYLIMENIKQGPDRVDIPQYRANQTLSFILRRDRYDESQTMLNTYATERGLSEGFLGVKYPNKKKIASEDISRIEKKISEFEKALYSEEEESFLSYRSHIDLSSFVDYFVFNELFMNYDAGFNSTYLYLDYTGKLTMGPFWDFDQCLANDTAFESKIDSTAFHSAPWFRQLLRDPNFVVMLEKRYHELRADQFSDASLMSCIKTVRQYLGSAAQRDWNRWQYDLAAPLNPHAAAPQSFDEAAETLTKTLLVHARWLDRHINSLYQFSDEAIEIQLTEERAREEADRYGDLLAVVFIGAFIISALLLRREL